MVIHKLKNRFLKIYLCLFLFSGRESLCCAEDLFSPWSVSENVPVVVSGKPTRQQSNDQGIAEETLGQDYCAMLVRFYQNCLSIVTISHCPMIPSCSRYSLEAIRKNGPWMGILMTVDRLFHEGDERQYAKEVWQDGKLRYLDPVENNDFWWHEK